MPVITAATLRTYNLVGISGSGDDAYLEGLIGRADAALATLVGMPPASATGVPTLGETTHTHYLHGPDVLRPRVLRLPVRPVVSITSVHQDADWSYGADTLVDAAEYMLDPAHGELHLTPTGSTTWQAAHRVIKVVYVAGWSTLRDDLAQAVGMLARHWHDLKRTQGADALSLQGRSQTLASPMIPAHVVQLVRPHTVPQVDYAA